MLRGEDFVTYKQNLRTHTIFIKTFKIHHLIIHVEQHAPNFQLVNFYSIKKASTASRSLFLNLPNIILRFFPLESIVQNIVLLPMPFAFRFAFSSNGRPP